MEEDEEEIWETIVCNGNEILLRTPKKTPARMTPITSKENIEHVDTIPDDIEDEVSENEIMRMKTAKKRKKVEFQGTSLKDLCEKLNVE